MVRGGTYIGSPRTLQAGLYSSMVDHHTAACARHTLRKHIIGSSDFRVLRMTGRHGAIEGYLGRDVVLHYISSDAAPKYHQ